MKWLLLVGLLSSCGALRPDEIGVNAGMFMAGGSATTVNRTPSTTGSVDFATETDDIPYVGLFFAWAIGERARHVEDREQRERHHAAILKEQENTHMMLMAIGGHQGATMPIVIKHDDPKPDGGHEEKDKAFAYMGTVIAGICLALMGLITFLVKGKKKSEIS